MDEQDVALSEAQMRGRVVDLVFGGDDARLEDFCRVIREVLPPTTSAVLRGSAVTGVRWKDNTPFDADGPGTSDLDLTLVGPNLAVTPRMAAAAIAKATSSEATS